MKIRWIFLLPVVLIFSVGGLVGARKTAKPSPDPVRIGATVSKEGKYRETSFMMENGYRLWARQVNEKGGLLGRPVELVLLNDESDPEKAGSLYEALIEEHRVDLVLSPYGSPLTLKASEATEGRGYFMLAAGASSEQIWQREYRYIFGMYAPAGRYFIGFLDLVARQGMKSVAIVFERSSFHEAVARGARRWAERFGLKVVYEGSFDDPVAQIPGLLEEVSEKSPHGLVFSAYPRDGYAALEWMDGKKYRPAALGLSIAPVLPDFYLRAGEMAENVFGPSQWEPDERIPFPGTKRFIRDFKALCGKTPSYHGGSAYASCQILEQAVKRTDSLDQKNIRDYILALDTVTVIGRFKVDHSGMQIGHNPILVQWQNGRKEIVYPTKMRTAPPRFPASNESR